MVAATIKNRWQHFLSIECCFQQGPQCKEARLLDYSVLKRERKMSAFPKIPHVVSMCSVGCCCSPPATTLLPDGSCSSGLKSSGDSCHEVLGTQQMLRGLSGYLCPYLSPGRGHSESAGLSQPSPSPWQICTFSTAWSTPHIPPPEAAAQAEESHVQIHFQTNTHGPFSSPQLPALILI